MALSLETPVAQRLQEIYEVLTDGTATEGAARNSARHSLVAGAGALLGAFVGGRAGGLVGGIAGATFGAVISPEYVALIRSATFNQRAAIYTIIKDIGLVAFQQFIRNTPEFLNWLQKILRSR